MAVISVATLTVGDGRWEDFLDSNKKAKAILEKYGAKNVRLLAPVSGAEPSGTFHSTFEADDLASLGKVLDSIYADQDMLALMQSGAASSWTSSILGEIPLT
jgi:hypothetical protein